MKTQEKIQSAVRRLQLRNGFIGVLLLGSILILLSKILIPFQKELIGKVVALVVIAFSVLALGIVLFEVSRSRASNRAGYVFFPALALFCLGLGFCLTETVNDITGPAQAALLSTNFVTSIIAISASLLIFVLSPFWRNREKWDSPVAINLALLLRWFLLSNSWWASINGIDTQPSAWNTETLLETLLFAFFSGVVIKFLDEIEDKGKITLNSVTLLGIMVLIAGACSSAAMYFL